MPIKQILQNIDSGRFFLIAGPCVIESRGLCFEIAEKVLKICNDLDIQYIFKASYRKANRSRLDSFTGIGDHKGLQILLDIRSSFNIPVTTDVHTEKEAVEASEFVDILQIPAFLCRQTNLLLAAAQTGKIVNIKKGQFVSGPSMKFAKEKVNSASDQPVWLTERGSTFGYQDLVVDMRNIPWMQALGSKTILDCTHSLQEPNQVAGVTGGRPDLIGVLARCGVAAGCDGIFIETHPDPATAKSDGANMLNLAQLKSVLEPLMQIRNIINSKIEK